MNVFYYDYYYYYYYGWEFIGLFGIGILSVIGSFLALIGLLKKAKVPLAIGGLLNIYNAGGVMAFLAFWYLPEVIGIGAIICLIAGLVLLVSAFLPDVTSHQTMNYESYQMSSVSNIVPGYNRVENNSTSLMQQNEYSSSPPLIRYCRFCGKKL
ncbi:hypothetical protein [Candidatus Borrarchaeum sp.]|uniref:hypothetical protein n=1 Tax=Candidatus Borrarchaeum sp. TaxID=2846742 RepID=UPI00257C3DE8|nr:hypothetical protein [Candidatus Borrarchaeum sp.]